MIRALIWAMACVFVFGGAGFEGGRFLVGARARGVLVGSSR